MQSRIIIGVDVGISTTKIVGIRNGKVLAPVGITATDPVSSLYGAFGKYLYDNDIKLDDIEKVMITGVGAGYVKPEIFGCLTEKVDEYVADALGAAYKSELDKMIVVSMGTGTTYVKKVGDEIEHLGGIGLGGGALQGLSRVILKTDNIKEVEKMAEKGDISKVDLLIGDISKSPLPNLPVDVTASLLAKVQTNSRQEDLALGIIHAVLQTIGSCAVFTALHTDIKNFVMIGNLSLLPQCKMAFAELERLYGVRFHIPPFSQFRTAIGAALYGIKAE